MTHGEFISRTYFMTDAYGVIPATIAARAANSCGVVPAGRGRTARRERDKAAVARLEKACRDARIAGKLDRVAELMDRVAAARSRPIPDAEDAGPSVWELVNQYQPSAEEMSRAAAEEMDRRCAESQAAYAARNPHKRKEAAI